MNLTIDQYANALELYLKSLQPQISLYRLNQLQVTTRTGTNTITRSSAVQGRSSVRQR